MIYEVLFYLLIQYALHHSVSSKIIAIDIHNISETFRDRDAWFGTAIGPDGIEGLLVKADPLFACSSINPPNTTNFTLGNTTTNFFVVIRRGKCSFAEKVFYAQKAKYSAAIIYNVGSDQLVTMTSEGSDIGHDIVIPSVFVGETSGYLLEHFYTFDLKSKPRIEIYNDHHPTLDDFLIPFSAVLGASCFCLLICLSFRYVRGQVTVNRNRLSMQRLRRLPIKKYTKGEECDMCAICLDDYVEGECLRVLPCKHAYHCECIDPWLTRAKRVCPLCKRRVLSDDNASSDGDQRPPRPSLSASPNAPRYGTGFTRRNPFRRYSSSSDCISDSESFEPETEEESLHFSIDRIVTPPLPEPTGFSVASSFEGNLPSSPVHEIEDAVALNDEVITVEASPEYSCVVEKEAISSTPVEVIVLKESPGDVNQNREATVT